MNAANEKAIRSEDDLLDRERELELNDLRIILGTAEGRRFVWRILNHCKVFGSIWTQSAAIHYLAGKQDVGHFILAEITQADEDQLFAMMRENKASKESRAALLESLNQGENDV